MTWLIAALCVAGIALSAYSWCVAASKADADQVNKETCANCIHLVHNSDGSVECDDVKREKLCLKTENRAYKE